MLPLPLEPRLQTKPVFGKASCDRIYLGTLVLYSFPQQSLSYFTQPTKVLAHISLGSPSGPMTSAALAVLLESVLRTSKPVLPIASWVFLNHPVHTPYLRNRRTLSLIRFCKTCKSGLGYFSLSCPYGGVRFLCTDYHCACGFYPSHHMPETSGL